MLRRTIGARTQARHCLSGGQHRPEERGRWRLRTLVALGVGVGAALAACTEPNPYLNVCGNGQVEAANDETCDDGEGNDDGAACTSECRVAVCGDGLVQAEVEACDLGELNSAEGPCSLECTLVSCGDGKLDPGEACDEGPANRPEEAADGQGGCSQLCLPLPRCGDGIVHGAWEACDDANDDETDACLSTCEAASCGDGVIFDGVEECDDGDDDNGDGCPSTCELARCGDGFVLDGVEECDDGDDDNSDECLSSCLLARCGDGVLQVGAEECDDGNLEGDDGCNAECVRDRAVFVTEESIFAGEVGGIDGADARCQAAAMEAGLERVERFRAWISDSNSSPSTRFETRQARYVLTDGSVIAENWEDLTDGQLSHPLNRYADGSPANEIVWTGTLPNGEAADNGSFCGNWTLVDLNELVEVGATDQTNTIWTYFAGFPSYCSDFSNLYCFED